MTKSFKPFHLSLFLLAIVSAYAWFLILIPIDQPDFYFHIKNVAETKFFFGFPLWIEAGIYSSCRYIEIAPVELLLIQKDYYCGFMLPLVRLSRFMIVTLPIFLILVTNRKLFPVSATTYLMCINTPGFVQVLSYHSIESIFLVLAFLCVGSASWLITLFVSTLGFIFFDAGSAIIFLLFSIFLFLWKTIGLRTSKTLIIFLTFYFFIVFIFGINVLTIFKYIPIVGDKFLVVFEHYTTYYSYVYENYPPPLRPVLTFTGIFTFTPMAYGSVWLGLFCYLFVLASTAFPLLRSAISNSRIQNQKSSDLFTKFIPSILFIIGACTVLPGYSNVKYFIFCLPLLIKGLSDRHSSKKVFSYIFIVSGLSYLVVFFEVANQKNLF